MTNFKDLFEKNLQLDGYEDGVKKLQKLLKQGKDIRYYGTLGNKSDDREYEDYKVKLSDIDETMADFDLWIPEDDLSETSHTMGSIDIEFDQFEIK